MSTAMYDLVWPSTPSDIPVLDEAAQQLLGTWAGPLLVLGGPGTGKTTFAAQAALAMLRQSGQPLIFARTRQAASTLRNLVTAGLAGAVWQPAVTTVHAFCRSVLLRFGDGELRLLTAPEQEYRVRELLVGQPQLWPESLRRAVGTATFARQVRAALARARQLGLDPSEVEAAGLRANDDVWVALGRFFAEYLDILDAEQTLDYAELVHRTRIALAQQEIFKVISAEVDAVIVDDYPELDPAHLGVVAALAPRGTKVLATGDPHTVLSAFRGAHPQAIFDFGSIFVNEDGSPGRVAELRRGYRQGGALAAALISLASRFSAPVVGGTPRLVTPQPAASDGTVAVIACSSEATQATAVATEMRRARMSGLSWSKMAVIVRSGSGSIGAVTRALSRAGVPVEVAADDVPLAEARPVQVLLAALDAAASGRVAEQSVENLLVSPLAGLDQLMLRQVVRAHRALVAPEPMPQTARLVLALGDADWAGTAVDTPWQAAVAKLTKFAQLLRQAHAEAEQGRPASEIAWNLWQRSGWAAMLDAELAAGGALGVQAGRDLAALRAFFAFATEQEHRTGMASIRMLQALVEAQQIPADYEREARIGRQGVEVLTVHRAKGRSWPLVVVVGANEGVWPVRRHPFGQLAVERLRSEGLTGVPDPREQVATERRSFYAACATAENRLVVTYVGGAGDETALPSRFVSELMSSSPEPTPVVSDGGEGDPDELLDLSGLIARLRREAVQADSAPTRRVAATAVLGLLAVERDDRGKALAPAANPASWWGTRKLSGPPPAPRLTARLSPSQVTSLLDCPRQYFLAREAKADAQKTGSQEFGALIHRLIQHCQLEGWGKEILLAKLNEAWQQMPYDISWVAAGQLAEAERALGRFLAWQRERTDVEVVGVERPFQLEMTCGDVELTLIGTVDRLERGPDGRLRVLDFKTSNSVATQAKTAELEQLGVYQLAITDGAFGADGIESAGAGLVFLRKETATGLPVERKQPSLSDHPYLGDGSAESRYPTWVHERLTRAAQVLSDGGYPATPGESCKWCSFADSCPASKPRGGAAR